MNKSLFSSYLVKPVQIYFTEKVQIGKADDVTKVTLFGEKAKLTHKSKTEIFHAWWIKWEKKIIRLQIELDKIDIWPGRVRSTDILALHIEVSIE